MTAGGKSRTIVLVAIAIGAAACSNGGSAVPAVGSAPASLLHANEAVKIVEFADLPRYHDFYFPTALTVGPDGALWVTDDIDQDAGSSVIARVTTSGKLTNTYYFQNYASPAFEGIATGADGALWATDLGDSLIVRMTTQGAVQTFSLDGAGPEGIAEGPDGAIWFVANGFNSTEVGRITTGGTIKLFTHGITQSTGVQGITPGPDDALWFTEPEAARIGRITTHGKVTEYFKGITPGSRPFSIASGPDGALWFTEMAGGRIGRITTAGKVTEYSSGITRSEQPIDLSEGPDKAMWFTEYESYDSYKIRASKIGRIASSGKISEYSNIDSKSEPTGIVQGPRGDMWFVETNADKLGRVKL